MHSSRHLRDSSWRGLPPQAHTGGDEQGCMTMPIPSWYQEWGALWKLDVGGREAQVHGAHGRPWAGAWWTWRQLEKRTRSTSPRTTHHLGPSPQAHRALRSWRWSSTKIQQNSTEEITAPIVVDCIHGIHWLQAAAIYPNSSGVGFFEPQRPMVDVLLAMGTPLSWKKIVLLEINTWLGFVINPAGPFEQMAREKHVVLALLKELAEGKIQMFSCKPLRLGESTGPLPHAHSQSHFSSLSGSGK